MRIIFMGTPDFAVESLRILVENHYNVVAVLTSPDKPAGRGLKMIPSAVKTYAKSVGLPVLQPEKLKNESFLATLRSFEADLQVVVAFRMLPEVVWNMPRLGTFNLHASLLPQYRGAAPINWAIIRGEQETGVTTFFLQHEIDTGPLIFQEKEPIGSHDTAGQLYERLMQRGAGLVLRTVRAIEGGSYPQIPQPEAETLRLAPKIFKETCQIDFDQPAQQVHDFVRGLSPHPGAWTWLKGKLCKIYLSDYSSENQKDREPGIPFTDQKTFLRFACSTGFLEVKEIQMEGKKRMPVAEFLRGFSL
jgi:methionyl-tRNA formyltransferase